MIVNPSREEVWWANFDAVKRFYNEYKHLTIPDKRLSGWLTYQRHHAKTLSQDKLDALESIDYKSVKVHRECDEREWEANFNQLISASSSTKKTRKNQLWLARQRRLAASNRLSATRKERLLEHGIDLQSQYCGKCGMQRPITTTPAEKEEGGEASTPVPTPTTVRRPSKSNEAKWMEKFTKLLKYREKHGDCNVPVRFAEDPSLGHWVFNQRRLFREVKPDGRSKLPTNRINKLEEIGFQWEVRGRRVV